MKGLFIIGVILNLAGVLLAMTGVDELSSELFPGRPPPHRAAWQRMKRFVGIKPPTQVISVGAVGSMAIVGSARGQAVRPRPAQEAPQAVWNTYFDSRLENLSERIDWAQEDSQKGDASILVKLADETSARTQADAQLEQRLRTVVGGEGGRGLAKAWYGLALTALGTLLQAIAG